MVDKPSGLQQALSALRQAAIKANTPASAARSSPSGAPDGAHQATKTLPLSRRIELKVARLDKDDPQRRRKALRIVVETALLSEFGERLESDPSFHAMVDQVVETLDGEAALRPLVEEALVSVLG